VPGRVAVIRRPCKKFEGSTRLNSIGDYTIYVNSDLEWSGQVDTLIHEWAHVLAIEEAFEHGDSWGLKFAEVYRSITEK